ncbi:carbohydrate ABC transporter permease [Acidipropionibacterium acidipropionici]|uniref:carbohydrate ABC transporter permease n=1 Tax=Acidipropionibacterium acidipropionici TaxID=1748 RepID=UPI00040F201B|nr:carbohydrate ABC transporter permease [Acidipropionibacterium acidipropionici]ALN14926.1 sugar ABC transporter ATP-binding protein [Acidipropionibacterium acidipropionici]APZ09324.1 sugar ABC transporter ATP-binding protein [Acidipropionibacterium acidipropionici]
MTQHSTTTTTRKVQSNTPAARVGRGVIYVILALVVVACLLPFVWLVRSSLMNSEQIFSYPPEWIPKPFEWSNFSGAMTSAPFGRYFLNTLTVVVLVVPGTILATSAAAFAFSRLVWKGRTLCFWVSMATMMLPYAATLIPTFIGWQAIGAVDTYFPLVVPAWFAVGGASNIFMLRQFFLQIPHELDEAMYVDGGSPWRVFWSVILPLNAGPLTLVGIFSTIGACNDLLGPLIYLSDQSKFTLSLGLASFRSLYSSQWGYLMAASLLVILPILVLFAFAQRMMLENVALTGLKG